MIRIYPSRLPGEPLETHPISRRMMLADWLAANVLDWRPDGPHPITIDVSGMTLPPELWSKTEIGPDSDVRIYPAPRNSVVGAIFPFWAGSFAAADALYGLFEIPEMGSHRSGRSLEQGLADANLARPNGVVRELLGQRRIYPDLISAQVTRFVNKRRMQTRMLLCIGSGEYSVLAGSIRVGNTPLLSMGDDASYQIYGPGQGLGADPAAENWYLCPEVGATGAGTPGLDLGSEETAGEGPTTDAIYLNGKTMSLVGQGAEFPVPWTQGAVVIIQAPDSYTITQSGVRSRISGPLSDLGPSVGMKISLYYLGDQFDLVVTDYSPAVPPVPGVGGSPSYVHASSAPSTYDFSVNPAVWTLTYQGVTRTLSCASNYNNMSELVADITAQLAGMGLVAQDYGGVLRIIEPFSPYRGGTLSQSSAPIELFGVAPTYVVGTASSGGTPGQDAYIECDYDDARGVGPATPFSGLPLGGLRLALTHRGARYAITAISSDEVDVERVDDLGVVQPWAGWAPRTVIDFSAVSAPSGDNWLGPFYACPEGQLTTRIEYDIFFPAGLVRINGEGKLRALARYADLEWRDSALGGAWNRVSHEYVEATLDQIGFTHGLDLPYPMRPQVRLRRRGATGDSRHYEKMNWYGLRARLPHATSYSGVTTMTVSMRSGSRLSSQSDRKINLVANRLYPGGLSRSVQGAALCVLDSLGIDRSLVDADQIAALQAAYWGPRGETFDADFTDQQTVRDVLQTIFAAGMGHLKLSGGLISATREGVQSMPVGSLSPHEMTGELRVSFTAPSEDSYDGVDVQYMDSTTWTLETVECRLPGSVGRKVEQITVEGVNDRTRAWRIGMRRLRKHVGQRMEFECETELDALNFEFGDRVALFDDLPHTTISALIVDAEYVDDLVILTVSEDLDWSVESPRCMIRRHDGSVTPVLVPARLADNMLSLPIGAIDFELVTDLSIEPARLMFGPSTRIGYDALVTEIRPGSDGKCALVASQYSPDFYADDDNAPAA